MWLLIGGSGFIGTNFAYFLEKKKIEYCVYDVRDSPHLPKKKKLIIGDVRERKKLEKAMKNCDVVFHLATIPPSVNLTSREIYEIDVIGTQNVLKAAKKNKVKTVVFASSASHVYGKVKDPCPLNEETRLNPINDYGKNKVCAEKLCKKFSMESEIQIIVLRLSMVFGLYNTDPVLVENVKTVLKNKKILLPGQAGYKNQCIHVDDVSSALLACTTISNQAEYKHLVLNIAGSEVITLDEWANLLKKIVTSSSKIVYVPVPLAKVFGHLAWRLHKTAVHPSYITLIAQDLYFDCTKAQQILHWKVLKKIEDGLADNVNFLITEKIN